MERGLPAASTVTTAVGMAVRAPSAHNAQPWRFAVGYRSLHLYADASRPPAGTVPDERDLVLSCGAALHHLRIAFAALGWRAETHRLPDPADPDHLAAVELHRHEPTLDEVALAAAIPLRRTDRRRHSSWRVPRRHLAGIAEAVAEEGVVVCVAEEAERCCLATAIEEALGEDDETVLLVLSTASDDRLSRLRAGEATSAALLTATRFGLASCPLTEPLELPGVRRTVEGKVTSGAFPQLVLRIGWAPANADPLPATPRYSVDDVLQPLEARVYQRS
ncbi:NAD(P)H nitroreductase [Amycolatopsis silviterrae]|uniref:NAD(P)H nitroreductase n=1 Tax=Amycolatopsis silviterrae TaxID=1656914 RepID=A0ABW5H5X4_9PSEU